LSTRCASGEGRVGTANVPMEAARRSESNRKSPGPAARKAVVGAVVVPATVLARLTSTSTIPTGGMRPRVPPPPSRQVSDMVMKPMLNHYQQEPMVVLLLLLLLQRDQADGQWQWEQPRMCHTITYPKITALPPYAAVETRNIRPPPVATTREQEMLACPEAARLL